MKAVGIQEAQLFNVKLGHPKGPATYLSPLWLEMFKFAATEAERLGLELAFHNGAGWSSSGGPWIKPEFSMQHVVFSEISLSGGKKIRRKLPQPETKLNFYRDITILAFPKPQKRIVIDELDIKTLSGRIRNHVAPDTKVIDPAGVVQKDQIIDLSSKLNGDGVLEWQAPEGEWVVLRLGHTSTGKTNHPATDGGSGLECDKMSKQAVEEFWKGGIDPILKALGPLAGSVVNNCLIDSYEVGTANWTADFKKEFERLRGYDCSDFLPALAGYYVDSGQVTERFLWDFRRSIGDLMAENYYGHFRDLCHQHGLKFSVEPYWGPFDNMQVGATGDIVMCEFWSGELLFFDSPKFVASIANLKGSPIVAAESFTGNGGWLQHPATLKSIGDRAWAQGINRFTFHTYVHQPWDVPPGLNLGIFGIDFNRLNTWWEPGKAFLDYIARSQFLLQQGRPVADVLVFTGESSPNDAWMIPEIKELGFDYDLIGANSLELLTVKGGLLTTPAGRAYRMLVLPSTPWMKPETLEKFAELAEAGASIIGARPNKSPGLNGYPACDEKVASLAAKLWDSGLIKEDSVLKRLADGPVPPDFYLEKGDRGDIDFIHRRHASTDLYFIANSSEAPRQMRGRFRVSGMQPEFWDTQTGEIRDATVWQSHDDSTTSVDLEFAPEASVFVIFRRAANTTGHLTEATVRGDERLTEPLPRLKIIKAEYGSFLQNGLIDVTATVAAQVKDRKLKVFANRELSGTDPAPGYTKELRIAYTLGQATHEVRAMERESVLIDAAPQDDLKIVRAVFGKFDVSTHGVPSHSPASDVTQKITAMVSAGQLEIPVGGSLIDDSSTNQGPEELRIVYATDGEQQKRSIPKGKTLDLSRNTPESRLVAGQRGTHWLTPHAGELSYRVASGEAGTLRVDSVPDSLALTGPWELRFPPGLGAPETANFDELASWSDSDNTGIRHFSGTASYTKSFALPEELAQSELTLELDLGSVFVMAEVIVNGTSLGTLWKQPFRVDLGDSIKAGENRLEIKVTNLWPNRLIGDESLKLDFERRGRDTKKWPAWLLEKTPRPSDRLTFHSHQFWDQDSELLPSGLLGPVIIRPYLRVQIPE
jgi:hypothetical protein